MSAALTGREPPRCRWLGAHGGGLYTCTAAIAPGRACTHAGPPTKAVLGAMLSM